MSKKEDIEKEAYIIPDWMPRQAWEEYVSMRKKIKKPMTKYGMYLATRQLDGMRLDGQDIEAVLNRSTQHSWTGLYEIQQREKKESIAGAWWQDERSIIAKGREFGLDPLPGETLNAFKARVQNKMAAVNSRP